MPFLWLDPKKYPQRVSAPTTTFVPRENFTYTLAQFTKTVTCPHTGKPHTVRIDTIFADTCFRLFVNGQYVGSGPVSAGGDYGNTRPMPIQYTNHYEFTVDADEVTFLVDVHTPGDVMTDYSCGRGGFFFAGSVDGEPVESDESWLTRVNGQYPAMGVFDATKPAGEWEKPHVLRPDECPWHLETPDIPMMTEHIVTPAGQSTTTENGNTVIHAWFDRIYSLYPIFRITKTSDGPATVRVGIHENRLRDSGEEIITVTERETIVRGLRIWSTGEVLMICPPGVTVELSGSYVHYPTDTAPTGTFRCSDEALNQMYGIGAFTLEMCRQTLHLDSPHHQETLGCTGDYAIEALMTRATFGDMRLARLDLRRTADYLRMTGGYMFHTTYSLIWAMMLDDYAAFTGDGGFVKDCIPALDVLLGHFAAAIGEHGVIEKPLNYMFVEWGKVDGYAMHHPPMALGQTALNAFYQGALRAAVRLYRIAGLPEKAVDCVKAGDAHKKACRAAFYDEEFGVFRDGFTKAEADYEPNEWLPANAEKVYHTRHANTLAVLYGLVDGGEARALMERILTNETLDGTTELEIQPYFMHYVMEAVWKTGLFAEYGLPLLHLWDKQAAASPRGMKEGWGAFNGDRSHAWGATPVYQLPVRLLGFELLKPDEFTLKPDRHGLDWVEIAIPTPGLVIPDGLIRCTMRYDDAFIVTVPDNWIEIAPLHYKRRNEGNAAF